MKLRTKTVFPLLAVFVISIVLSVSPAFAEVTIVPDEGSSSPNDDCTEVEFGCYIPGTATVDVGEVVIFSNTDNGIHTFTSGDLSDDDAGSEFDTGMLQQDQSFEFTPENVGEFPYFCQLHPWMQAMLIVQEAGAGENSSMMDDKMSMKMDLNEIMAEIKTSDGMANEPMSIDLTMTDLDGNGIEHITYNIKATQGSELVLNEEGHMHKGTIMNNHVTSALSMDASDSMPVVVTVESVGFGHDDLYVDVTGEIATKQVVPEFGTIAAMVLAIAIISIIAVSAKSKISIMPKL